MANILLMPDHKLLYLGKILLSLAQTSDLSSLIATADLTSCILRA
jgi:hypothetical protein